MVDFLTSNLIMKKHGILLYQTLFTTDKTTSLLIHHLSDVTNTSHNYLPCEILARVLQAIHFYHKPCGIPHTIFTIYIYPSLHIIYVPCLLQRNRIKLPLHCHPDNGAPYRKSHFAHAHAETEKVWKEILQLLRN